MSGYSLSNKNKAADALKPISNALTDWSDEQLMLALSQGRLSCGAVLFERHQRTLVNFFHRLCGRLDWSEDLGQITFERIIRYRHTYRPEMPFRAWLYRIARGQMADYAKRHGREMAGIYGEEHRFGQEAPVINRMESSEQEATLQKAMQALPPDYREILLMTRYQGMKYQEVGQTLGLSEGAVKVKVYRAIQQLKALYFKFDQQ